MLSWWCDDEPGSGTDADGLAGEDDDPVGPAGDVAEVAERNVSSIFSLSDSMTLIDTETGHFFCDMTVRTVGNATQGDANPQNHVQIKSARQIRAQAITNSCSRTPTRKSRERIRGYETLTSPHIPINEPRRAQEPQMFRPKVQVRHQPDTLRHERETPFVVFASEDGEEVYGHWTAWEGYEG